MRAVPVPLASKLLAPAENETVRPKVSDDWAETAAGVSTLAASRVRPASRRAGERERECAWMSGAGVSRPSLVRALWPHAA